MTIRLEGHDAIDVAEVLGLTLCKYADPIIGARTGLTPARAYEVAREDPRLIYLDIDALDLASMLIDVLGRDTSLAD
jgi:hypothetical protein